MKALGKWISVLSFLLFLFILLIWDKLLDKLQWLATMFRYKLCKYFPKVALWIYSFHKGECKNCGSCCRYCNIYGEKLAVWTGKMGEKNVCHCKDNDKKPLTCKVGPLPFDVWWNDLHKNCGIYYFFKPKWRLK